MQTLLLKGIKALLTSEVWLGVVDSSFLWRKAELSR